MSPPDYAGVEVVRGESPSPLTCFINMSPQDYTGVEVVRGGVPLTPDMFRLLVCGNPGRGPVRGVGQNEGLDLGNYMFFASHAPSDTFC